MPLTEAGVRIRHAHLPKIDPYFYMFNNTNLGLGQYSALQCCSSLIPSTHVLSCLRPKRAVPTV